MTDNNISGSTPIGPRDTQAYEKEYKQSANLFKQALDEYKKSDDMYQQAEYKKVMDKALNILNETAKALMRQELQKQNEQIAKDYSTFQKYPKDPDTLNKLDQDLEKAKDSIS